MIRSIIDIIPASYRRCGLWVTIGIVVRALLNFIGVAMLVPLFVVVLDPEAQHSGIFATLNNNLKLSNESNLVIYMCAAVLGLIILKNLAIILLHRHENSYILSVYTALSRQLFIGYYNRGLSFIKEHNSAHLGRNVNAISLMFATGVLKPLMTIAGEAILLALIFTALAIYSPLSALLAASIFAVIGILYYAVMRRRLDNIGAKENEQQRRKGRIVSETYRGYVDIEINGAINQKIRDFDSTLHEITELRQRHASIATLPQSFIECGLVVAMIGMVVFSMNTGNNTVMFSIFAIATIRLIPAIRSIMTSWSALRLNRHTIETLRSANIDEQTAPLSRDSERMELTECIELRNVSFKFDNAEQPTLEKISLKICRGESVGIQGASGVGKTTLFNIILGLYRPTSGTVNIDGIELNSSNIRKWQNSIGYVSQSLFISDSTLLENIAFGIDREEIDLDVVNKVIDLANLSTFVDSLPEGLNTRIGEQGARISAGQRQRIAIARALYRGCDVLLFDEATSSLDRGTEDSINEAIRGLKKANNNLTIVVIAHRESSLEFCDRIITLE